LTLDAGRGYTEAAAGAPMAMIKTSRSRLEIRQEPDAAARMAGLAVACFGLVEMLVSLGTAAASCALGRPAPLFVCGAGFAFGAACAVSAWLFLRGRPRVVLDRDHRMVARYRGVGGRSAGGNETWDLDEFRAVVLVSRERRRLLAGAVKRSFVVCLRRFDGRDLELYRARDAGEGARAASSVAEFAELPYYGREPL
jgi:hypothetical protein